MISCTNDLCKLAALCARQKARSQWAKSKHWKPTGLNCNGFVAIDKEGRHATAK